MSVAEGKVIMGRVTGPFGVRGWVKVFSDTEPRERIVDFGTVWLRRGDSWREIKITSGQRQGKGVVVAFEGIDERDAAVALTGAEIAVDRDRLEPPAEGEYYWADLIGLEVVNLEGLTLGRLDHLIATGANDVMVVRGERERLIPWVPGDVVKEVDQGAGRLTVDWDPDF